jgi:N-acetylneuraminic acid mutarotase
MIKIYLIILMLSYTMQSQQWREAGEMPIPVYGASAVVADSFIYIIGGYSDASQSPSKIIQIYRPSTGSWNVADSAVYDRYGLVSFTHNNNIFYFGGITVNSGNSGTMERWVIDSSPQIHDTKSQLTRSFAALVKKNNKLFVFGGTSTAIGANYMFEYNVQASNITYSNNFNFSLFFPSQQMAEIIEDEIFVFGGASLVGVSRNIYLYNTNNQSFSTLPIKMIQSRAGGSAVNYKGTIYIIGGFSESQSTLSSVEVFTKTGNNYSIAAGPSIKTARREHTAVLYNNRIYLFGGKKGNNDPITKIEMLDLVTSVNNNDITPNSYALHQNYPNPFNPTTKIKYDIPITSVVKLELYDLLGNKIRNIVEGEYSAGSYETLFDASELPSGIYFYKLSGNNVNIIKKMVLVK